MANKSSKTQTETGSARARKRVQVVFNDLSRTKQSFKEECDINNVLKKYGSTGQLPALLKENPKYGDFSNPLDYQESLNVVLHAQDQFSKLSSHVRERFQNDPQKFLEFTADPKNLDEMVKLGLAVKRPNDQTNDEKPASPEIKPEKKSKDSAPET